MKNRFLLAVMACVLVLVGCARTAPIANVSTTITGHYTADQVKHAILQAGIEREWIMTPAAPGVINGRLAQRGYVANIRVDYTATGYSINYVSSQNLRAGQGKIHRNYNRWVNNLDHDIQIKLASQVIQ